MVFSGTRSPRGGFLSEAEDQRERAARGDDGRTCPWGEEPPAPDRCVFGRDYANGHPSPSLEPRLAGASPWGALDMAGNVAEWCRGEGGPAGAYVCRGGSWNLESEKTMRAWWRERFDEATHFDPTIGFRPVKTAP